MTKSRSQSGPKYRHKQSSSVPEVVDPKWIFRAVVFTLIASVFCGYLTLCLLFYQGQWQLVLHPSKDVPQTPASVGLKFEPAVFAVDETGQPQLTGWYIEASPVANTVLYLHDGDSTMSTALPRLQQLHNLGFNLFAIDYRGYGASGSKHPSQSRMNEDAENTLQYLATTRGILSSKVIPYGAGVGASLAAHLAAAHKEIPAVILEDPKSDLLSVVKQDPRTDYIPLRILFHDRFPLAETLRNLHTPKLLIASGAATPEIFRNAADPKRTIEFSSPNPTAYADALQRFSEDYLHAAPVPILAPASK